MSCEYCTLKKHKPVEAINEDGNSECEIFIFDDDNMIYKQMAIEQGNHYVIISIAFCPKCGRGLS